jgi:hypothetical protein
VKWLSKPYALQDDTNGMSGVINAGVMVVDTLYFHRVKRSPNWYTQLGIMMVDKVRYVLQTGMQLQEISNKNKLPQTCNRMEAMRQKAVRVSLLDHEAIMEEAERRDQLEYDNKGESKDDELESKLENNVEPKSK